MQNYKMVRVCLLMSIFYVGKRQTDKHTHTHTKRPYIVGDLLEVRVCLFFLLFFKRTYFSFNLIKTNPNLLKREIKYNQEDQDPPQRNKKKKKRLNYKQSLQVNNSKNNGMCSKRQG